MSKDYSLIKKLIIFFLTIKNPYLLISDRLGLKKQIIYSTYPGQKFISRSKTTDINEAAAILSGREYPKEILDIERKKNPVLIDAGAHIGTFTIYAKYINPTAKIYAIEPLPENRAILKENIKLNSLKNIIVLDVAISDHVGKAELHVPNKKFDSATLNDSQQRSAGNESIKVRLKTLKQIVRSNNIKSIDVVKMDIEGAEINVIKSELKLFHSKVKRIILEYHPNYFPSSRKYIINIMKANDFKFDFEHRHILGFVNNREVS